MAPEKTDVANKNQFYKVVACASENKRGINMVKIQEPVFHRPHPTNLLLPTTLSAIKRVLSAKLLGVWLQSDMGMGIHVDTIAKMCKQQLYLLTQLQSKACPKAF